MEDACKVLQWLAFSARPVTVAEVAEALTVNIDHDHHLNTDRQLLDPHDMLKICSSLITISSSDASSGGGDDKGVSSVHYDYCHY
jgi:hypothetical protein